MRLQVYLARCGLGSRRACEALIRDGRVKVNGLPADQLGSKVDPEQDQVAVDGVPATLAPAGIHVMLHKPAGVMTTCGDRHAERTVLDLLPPALRKERLFPVGRLDKGSEGLVLMTNDGPLVHRLLHPSRHVAKQYRVELHGPWTPASTRAWQTGVKLDDGPTAPAEVVVERQTPYGVLLRVTLYEGRKRQLRRMAEAVGCRVMRLVRVALGPLELGELRSGASRPLRARELAALREAAGYTDNE